MGGDRSVCNFLYNQVLGQIGCLRVFWIKRDLVFLCHVFFDSWLNVKSVGDSFRLFGKYSLGGLMLGVCWGMVSY